MHVHSIDLILTLTGGLTAALLFGYVTHRLGLSPIVGYLIGGTLVGPHTPGFVADAHLAEQMAEIGVILLMFGVGLQFHIEELLAVRRIAIPGAVAQSAGAAVLGYLIAIAAGWSWQGGIIFGIALSVASTVVLIRVLSDNRDLHTQTGHIAVGWLVVEDLFTVIAPILTASESVARIFAPHGKPMPAGETFRNAELAECLEWLAEDGARLFLDGDVGQAIVAESLASGGQLTQQRGQLLREPLRVERGQPRFGLRKAFRRATRGKQSGKEPIVVGS